ncbi:MAG: hypothetical protein JSV91_02845 [Phycisphaerales bacterium]|nr:MAG: hypothetical protein JSV91_02845 [Phycisphaerales bacterium]
MRTKLLVAAAVLALPVVAAQADFLPLDPGTDFIHYSSNSNDGYSSYRGVVFVANEAIVITGAGLYTKSTGGLNANFRLWETMYTYGDVYAGATLVRDFNAVLQGDLGFHDGHCDDYTLIPGQSYLLQVGYGEAAEENWFFNFDPDYFGHDPVNIGAVTLIDGTLGGHTSNFVMPFMQLVWVPAPGALALLGLGLLPARRRR